MKKILLLSLFLTTALLAIAQQSGESADGYNPVFNACAVIFTAIAVMLFVLRAIKYYLDYRLKMRMLEKNLPEEMVSSILKPDPLEEWNATIKWFSLLIGTGVGLIIIYFSMPLGLHSLAIMAFSLAFSYFGYALWLKKSL